MKLAYRIAVFVLLVLQAAALAEPPKAAISGPTEVQPGDFIDLDASDSVADFYEWKIDPPEFADGKASYRLVIGEPQKHVFCQLASRPGVKFRIVLIVSNAEGIATTEHAVDVLRCPPGPSTPPVDPITLPPVEPVTPPPTQPLTIGQWIHKNIGIVTEDPNRKQTTDLLSASYKAFIVGGTKASTPEAFVNGQSQLNDVMFNSLGNKAAWDQFMTQFAHKLATFDLPTVRACQQLWAEISFAFAGVPAS